MPDDDRTMTDEELHDEGIQLLKLAGFTMDKYDNAHALDCEVVLYPDGDGTFLMRLYVNGSAVILNGAIVELEAEALHRIDSTTVIRTFTN